VPSDVSISSRATSPSIALDTQKSVLHVKGQLSLKSQALTAEVDADPESFDLPH
jgi:hypothetical protein